MKTTLKRKDMVNARIETALTDAIIAASRGDTIIYYQGRSGPKGGILMKARTIADRFNLAMVQKPLGPASNEEREWQYMVQI